MDLGIFTCSGDRGVYFLKQVYNSNEIGFSLRDVTGLNLS